MKRWMIYLLAAIWLAGPAAAETARTALPAVPDDPADDRACLALYGEYQAVVDALRAAAVACTDGYSVYTQTRYGHWFGAGSCRRWTVTQCRHQVEQCTEVSRQSHAALAECRAKLRRRGGSN